MKNILEDLNRLKIVTFLVKENRTFSQLKEKFNLSDGNLFSHLKKLETNEFIQIDKQKITKVILTKKGKSELKKHIQFLENLIKSN